MTGTSLDAVDCALVRIAGAGLGMRAELRGFHSAALGSLAEPLRELAAGTALTAERIAQLSLDLALRHVEAIRALLAGLCEPLDLVAVHGQTVFHRPPLSWQLLTPAPIARALRARVVFDLRAADLAAGGQGAPITPIADYVLFGAPDESRVVVNLGGFCNYTRLPARPDSPQVALHEIRAGDICACNLLLDALARRLLKRPFDDGGTSAAAGTPSGRLVAAFCSILAEQARSGRSLGSGDDRLDLPADALASAAPSDVLCSACEAIAHVIARTVGRETACAPARVLLAGGGTRNAALLRALRRRLAVPVTLTDETGIPAGAREAVAMAILGALCADGVSITLPQVTGCKELGISGCWCGPGASATGAAPQGEPGGARL